jgi:hypothetical protein
MKEVGGRGSFIDVVEPRAAVHGLMLWSDFELPGLSASAVEDATLELRLCSAGDLSAAWDEPSASELWRGRQGDGRDLSIERDGEGRLLFSYGVHARFLLDRDMARLDCAPTLAGMDWKRILIGKVIPAIAVLRGAEGLHAAALDSPDGVVAIMAPSGTGKSTLAAALIRRGWNLFADDQLTLTRDGGQVSALPGPPHMNLSRRLPTGVDASAIGETLGVFGTEQWLLTACRTQGSRPVAALCWLERAPGGRLQARQLAPSPVPLSPYVLGLTPDPERTRDRFELLADLVASAQSIHLSAATADSPQDLAETLMVALEDRRSEPVAS